MQQIISQLECIVTQYGPQLQKLDDQEASYKPSATKWSKKELIGHMIDSAQNNIRRFIIAQYEEKPLIRYAQDDWVKAAGYQQQDLKDIVQLWILLNYHIINILKNIPNHCFKEKFRQNNYILFNGWLLIIISISYIIYTRYWSWSLLHIPNHNSKS